MPGGQGVLDIMAKEGKTDGNNRMHSQKKKTAKVVIGEKPLSPYKAPTPGLEDVVFTVGRATFLLQSLRKCMRQYLNILVLH